MHADKFDEPVAARLGFFELQEVRGAGDLHDIDAQQVVCGFCDRRSRTGIRRRRIARDDAQLIISRDAELKTPRGEALRTMLYLFEQDEAIKTLRSG